jgi:hypothetical protein
VAGQKGVKASVEGALKDARSTVKNIDRREQAWSAFYSGFRTFLTASVENGRQQLVQVNADHAASLAEPERDVLQELLGEAADTVVESAADKLDRAEELIDQRRFVQADKTLDEAEQSQGLKMSGRLQRRLQSLREDVQKAEQAAADLLAQTRTAYQREDEAAVASLLGELRERYKHTEVYQKNLK